MRADGLRRTVLRALRQGLPVAVAVTVVGLLLDESDAVLLWGALLIVGASLVPVGVFFWGASRVLMRLNARWTPEDPTVQDPVPEMLRWERIPLRIGMALVLSWLLLSAALLLRGETLF